MPQEMLAEFLKKPFKVQLRHVHLSELQDDQGCNWLPSPKGEFENPEVISGKTQTQ